MIVKNIFESSPFLFIAKSELPDLRKQFQSSSVFAKDREILKVDLAIIYAGNLAPTSFSWWCVNLPDAVVGGQYQASLESLQTAWNLLEDSRAPCRARELLLAQAALPTWKERNYGLEMGHDLSSSHHCRGFAAGLEVARSVLSQPEVEMLVKAYAAQIRLPYLEASFSGNPYLVGNRNTNWLAHLSGSVLLCELALAKFGKEDKPILALAKANVLRYVDMIRPDGSLPENGDYFHYGVEFALLSLHAWYLHYGENIITGMVQTGLRHAIHWPLAFTDENGIFWANFGDSHIGNHEASRAVGYLAARHFKDSAGQWLGDQGKTREPLAALLRPPPITSKFIVPRFQVFTSEQVAVVNFRDRHLAISGGACRSPINNIPHRHYDSGSVIYRVGDTNIIADPGYDKYTDTYWTNYDEPNHERSAAKLHNVVLVDGRGYQNEDQIAGRLVFCREVMPDFVAIVWELVKSFPGLLAWERQILILKNGPLIIIDNIKMALNAKVASIFWHLHETPTLTGSDSWQTSLIQGRVIASQDCQVSVGLDHPIPYVKVVINSDKEKSLTSVSVWGSVRDKINEAKFDEKFQFVELNELRWNIKTASLSILD